jgi:hypothetical protein
MLRWGSVCCHLDRNFLSSYLQSKNLKDENRHNYSFGCCLYRRETWSCMLSQECRLRVLQTRVQMMIFGPMREERPRYLILILCNSYHILTTCVCMITVIQSVIISYSFLHAQIDLIWYKLLKKYFLHSGFNILRGKNIVHYNCNQSKMDIVVNMFVSDTETSDLNNVNGLTECTCCVQCKHTLETVLLELSSARKIIQLLQKDTNSKTVNTLPSCG